MIKPALFLSVIMMLINVNNALSGPKGKKIPENFFVGTYTDSGSEGIYSFSLDPETGKLANHGLAAKSDNPSFLALTADGKYLLAVRETKDEKGSGTGYVESFSVNKSGQLLIPVNKVPSGGAHPCYVSVNQNGDVMAANYSGGSVALFKLSESGKLSEPLDVKQHYGNGPNKERQTGAHVHSAFFEPGSNRIFVPDLGIDKVAVYEIDKSGSKLIQSSTPSINLPPGYGPRHLAFHPTLKVVYVVNELASAVTVVAINKDRSFTTLESVSSLPVGFKEPNTCADIHISKDGRFLYVSNRGLNSIAVFSVNPGNGKIVQIAQESTRGETPRNFNLSPDDDYLLAANQTTQNIVAFKRDRASGLLKYSDQIKALRPVCLLFR